MRPSRSLLPILILLTGACGETPTMGGDGGDAGSDAATSDADASPVVDVAAPMIPWLEEGSPVVLTPCPEGFREVTVDGVTECDPYPEGGRQSCPDGEAHFIGESGCRTVGSACPAGRWSEALPADGAVLYVDAAAGAGGDGSADAPFDALDRLPLLLDPGTTVALAAGSYDGYRPVTDGVAVIGKCAAETTVTNSDRALPAVFVANAPGEGRVADLTIAPVPRYGVYARGGAHITVEGVIIKWPQSSAVTAIDAGSRVTLNHVFVTEPTRPDAGDTQPFALNVYVGGAIDGSRVIVDGANTLGVQVGGEGASLSLSRAVISGSRNGVGGVQVSSSATATLTESLIEDNEGTGVITSGPRVTLALMDTVVRRNGPRAGGTRGGGVQVLDGSTLTATRVVIADNTASSLVSFENAASVALADVVVRGNISPGPSDESIAVGVVRASLTGERVAVTRNQTVGIFGSSSDLQFTDLVVGNTEEKPESGEGGGAIQINEGTTLTVDRGLVDTNREYGVIIDGSMATLRDVAIRGTQDRVANGRFGRGLTIYLGSEATLERLTIEDNRDTGLFVEDSRVTATDITVRRTADGRTMAGGRGIQVQLGAELEATRVLVAGSIDMGIVVSAGARVRLTDLHVADVVPRTCTWPGCIETGVAYAVVVISADLAIEDFTLEGPATCGLFLSDFLDTPAVVTLGRGTVSGLEIGACVQSEGFDIDTLRGEVQYRDNGLNLDATELPVPSVGGEIVVP